MTTTEEKNKLQALIEQGVSARKDGANENSIDYNNDPVGYIMSSDVDSEECERFLDDSRIFVMRHLSDHELYNEILSIYENEPEDDDSYNAILRKLGSILRDDEYWECKTRKKQIERADRIV